MTPTGPVSRENFMEITPPEASDWEVFLALAGQEGWRIPEQELELFRGPLSEGAFTLKAENRPWGFVTTVNHEASGWVGNLLVHPDWRGRGCGGLLFDHSLEVLSRRGSESIWLTASLLGRPLYEKRGFRSVDGVVRWTLEASRVSMAPHDGQAAEESLLRGDRLVWGECRRRLLDPLLEEGTVFGYGQSAALLQKQGRVQVLGPWVSPSLCPRENREVLAAVMGAAQADLVADVLESSPVSSLLAAAGFRSVGRCDLMVRGEARNVDLSRLVSLASLGSMG
jgi:GNAT superfamily N-acetyltransferase